MLYETLAQTNIMLILLYFGIWCGIIFEAKTLIEKIFSNNKIICFVFDIIYMTFCGVFFVIAKNIANYGEFRHYLLFFFVFGIVIEHICIGYLLLFSYNCFVKIKSKIHFKKIKSKFLQRLLK